MSKAAKEKDSDDEFEMSADELAAQEGRSKPRLVPKDGRQVEQGPPNDESTEGGDLAAQRLPGMELPAPPKLTSKQLAELTYHAQQYDKAKYKRVEMSNKETEKKKMLDAYMNSVGLDSFVYPGPDGKVMECFIDNNPVVKTRERKDEPELTQPTAAAEEGGEGEDDE